MNHQAGHMATTRTRTKSPVPAPEERPERETTLRMHEIRCPKCNKLVEKVMVGTLSVNYRGFQHPCGAKGRLWWTPKEGSVLLRK